MMHLIGRREWDTLRTILCDGTCDVVLRDKDQMSSIITFAVNFHAPPDILHQLCQANPEAVIVGEAPFRLARRNGSSLQTIIVLEGARQKALIKSFNNSTTSIRNMAARFC